MRDSTSAYGDERAPFSFAQIRANYRRRMLIAVLVTFFVVSLSALIWVKASQGTKPADLAAGIIAAFVISITIYILESQRELSTRQLELASLVHNSPTLRGLYLADENLRGLYLGDKDLRDANFSDCVCTEVVFCDSNLTNTKMTRARLDRADMRGCDLSGADLSGASLRDADFRNTKLDGADLSEANMNGARFNDASLVGTNFTGATARGAYFMRATMTDARLARADLRNAKLLHADLRRARLVTLDLTAADLSYADLTDTTIIRCVLGGCSMQYAVLKPQTFLYTDLAAVATLEDATIGGLDLSKMGLRVSDLGANINVSDSVVAIDVMDDEGAPPTTARDVKRFVATDRIG